jgi:tetratricopeptide (TPR) repeat protein
MGLKYVRAMLCLCLGIGAASSAEAAWYQAKSRHFIVYSDGGQQQLQNFAAKLEKFDYLLRKITNMPDQEGGTPVRVFLLANDMKLKALTHNPFVKGYYGTSDRFGYAVLTRAAKEHRFDLDADQILFHEYTHHFMLQNFPAAYPAWYVEGFAELLSVITFPRDGSIEFGHVPLVRAPVLASMSIVPLEKMFAQNTAGMKTFNADQYYATAWLLTHYFHYNPKRKEEFMRYLTDLTSGKKDIPVGDYFEGGFPALEADLRAYMRHRFKGSSFSPKSMAAQEAVLSPLDAAQGALIEDELLLLRVVDADDDDKDGQRARDRAMLLASVRQKAAQFADSGYAATVLAEAERAAGNTDAAMAAADRAVALDPAIARAHSVRADILVTRARASGRAEDWKAALQAIIRANRADMEDPVPLAQFHAFHVARGGKMPDVGYDGLYKAYTLLPQSKDYRFRLATALATKGDYADASILLDPIAFSPHPSPMRDSALSLKADMDAKRGQHAKSGLSADQ